MLRGALGVLGASALLAIGCAQAFALNPVPTVSVPTVPSVSVPVITSPVPSVSVPAVTTPVTTIPDTTVSSPSTPVTAPSAPSLPGSSTSSGYTGSSSGTGGSASGSAAAAGPGAKGQRSGKGPPLRSTPAQVSKPRQKPARDDAGRMALERLNPGFLDRSDRPQLPRGGGIHPCRHTGKEPVQLLRPNRRASTQRRHLKNPGCGRQGSEGHLGQPRDPGRRRTRTKPSVRAHAQKSTCGPGEEATKDHAEIAAFVDTPAFPSTGGAPVSPSAHGGESGSNGGVVAPEGVDPPANFLLQPRVPKLALTPDVDGGWSPTALSIAGAMFIALLVIALRELAERHRGREAGWR